MKLGMIKKNYYHIVLN